MENTFNTSRLVEASKVFGAHVIDGRKFANDVKAAMVEARIIGKLSEEDVKNIAYKAFDKALGRAGTDAERNLMRQNVHQAMTLCRNWSEVPESQHKAIFAGKVKISSAATKAKDAAIAKRDAAKRNEEAEAATIAANATPTAPVASKAKDEGKPEVARKDVPSNPASKAKLFDDAANAIRMQGELAFTDDEQEALIRLMTALQAYNASQMPQQEAA